MGSSPEVPGCMYQSLIMRCLAFLSAGKKTLEDGRRSNSHHLAYEKTLCSLWGIFIWFFPSQFFLTEVFFRGFLPKINYFFQLAHPSKLLDPIYKSDACCMYFVFIVFSGSAHTFAVTLHTLLSMLRGSVLKSACLA